MTERLTSIAFLLLLGGMLSMAREVVSLQVRVTALEASVTAGAEKPPDAWTEYVLRAPARCEGSSGTAP